MIGIQLVLEDLEEAEKRYIKRSCKLLKKICHFNKKSQIIEAKALKRALFSYINAAIHVSYDIGQQK